MTSMEMYQSTVAEIRMIDQFVDLLKETVSAEDEDD